LETEVRPTNDGNRNDARGIEIPVKKIRFRQTAS